MMSEETAPYTVPKIYGDAPLPKRIGPRSLPPLSRAGWSFRLEYLDAWDAGQETSGLLLDFGFTGSILNIWGGRTLLTWDGNRLVELAGD